MKATWIVGVEVPKLVVLDNVLFELCISKAQVIKKTIEQAVNVWLFQPSIKFGEVTVYKFRETPH